MGDFCGWVGGSGSDPTDSEHAERALKSLPRYVDEQFVAERNDVGHLAASVDKRTSSFAVEQVALAVIAGYPQWSDPTRARQAREIGHAAALLDAYRSNGAGVLDGLTGAFSLAVLDAESNEVFLAIDRHGIGTLLYCEPCAGQLAFATTAGPVRARFPEVAAISAQAIFDFFFFIDRVPAPFTIFEGIRKLPPGHFLQLKNGATSVQRYWQMTYRAKLDEGEDRLAEMLLSKLRTSVGSCLEDEDPAEVGCFLSGGLDSSTVLKLLSEVSANGARSFTIGFGQESFDETPYATLAANTFGSRHDIHYLEPSDVLEVLPRVAAAYDEPFANSSAIPSYFCALRAREAGIDMLLAGDGGDELFAGNSRYLSDRIYDHYFRIPGFLRHRVIEPFFDSVPGTARVPLLRKLRNYVSAGRLSVPQRMHYENLYCEMPPDQVFSPETLEAISDRRPQELIEEIYESAGRIPKVQKMMNLDLRMTLADSDLRKVEGMCRLAGLRVRFPFLDDDLVDFSASIPAELLMKGGVLRGFYKKALKGLLPTEIIEKEKKGFGLPYVELLRSYEPLKRIACDSLESLGTRGYFRIGFLEEIIRSIRSAEAGRVDGYVWDLMVLELWLQVHSR